MHTYFYGGLLVCSLLISAGHANAAQPQRIVSMNLCTDLLVLMLAAPEHIASVTFLAADPEYSPFAEKTTGIALNRGLAEEIIPLEPDVILTSVYSNRFTATLLTQLNYRVVNIPVESTLESVYEIIESVGAAIGEAVKARNMVNTMQQQLDKLRWPTDIPAKTVIVYLPNGYAYGQHSLVDDLLKTIGLRNLASEMGLGYWGHLTVEDLLLAKPDVIVLNTEHTRKPALATQQQRHPALAKFWATRQVVEVPSQLWQCGNPLLVEAARGLLMDIQPAPH